MADDGGRRPLSVVLVDDQPLVRAGIAFILSTEPGIDVASEAANGELGLVAVADHRPDVVLMDVRMPVLDGLAATRRIRDADGPPVLVLTTFDDDDVLWGAVEAGAAGFLLKDTSADDIIRAIRTVADGGSWIDPRVTPRLLRALRAGRPATPSAAVLDALSERELEVLTLVARGASNGEIADELFVSERTVKGHVGIDLHQARAPRPGGRDRAGLRRRARRAGRPSAVAADGLDDDGPRGVGVDRASSTSQFAGRALAQRRGGRSRSCPRVRRPAVSTATWRCSRSNRSGWVRASTAHGSCTAAPAMSSWRADVGRREEVEQVGRARRRAGPAGAGRRSIRGGRGQQLVGQVEPGHHQRAAVAEHDRGGLRVGPDVELGDRRCGCRTCRRPSSRCRRCARPGRARRAGRGRCWSADRPATSHVPSVRPAGVDDEPDGVGAVERAGRRRQVGAVEAARAVHASAAGCCGSSSGRSAPRVHRHVDAEQVAHDAARCGWCARAGRCRRPS